MFKIQISSSINLNYVNVELNSSLKLESHLNHALQFNLQFKVDITKLRKLYQCNEDAGGGGGDSTTPTTPTPVVSTQLPGIE